MSQPLNRAALAEQAGAPTPMARAGQGTMVEQSRAVAEVQAAITVAQRCPRDMARALDDLRQSCGIKEMAEAAFFRFPRGGQTITGASVHLAREAARCWGNIDYGLKELSRDDRHGQSEMLAFAWDMETNVRAETTFIVPHLRDKKGGPERLTDVRDIYENNANHGARRLREQVFAVLPRWFTEKAEEFCHDTLQNGGGEALPVRISKMVDAFAALGVARKQIEKRAGCAIDKIDAVTLANLTIVFKSLKRGEVRKEDEFPDDKAQVIESGLKVAAIEGGQKIAAPAAPPQDVAPPTNRDGAIDAGAPEPSQDDGPSPTHELPPEPPGLTVTWPPGPNGNRHTRDAADAEEWVSVLERAAKANPAILAQPENREVATRLWSESPDLRPRLKALMVEAA